MTHVLGLDLVQRAELPGAEHLLTGPASQRRMIDLVDRLVDQRAAAFGRPAPLDRTRVVLGRAIPLHVGVALQELAEPALGDRFLEELAGIVEAVLADDAEHDAAARGRSRSSGAPSRGWSRSASAPARASPFRRRFRSAAGGNPGTCRRRRSRPRMRGRPPRSRRPTAAPYWRRTLRPASR